ncbi:hypothetical protein DPMN_103587 [Dreissena polymorpha]|uniref:Sushi domain-containing protein n=1 Tax=Dreissena polymorpha TaxID=45954 RepID=A0A9D4JZB4_DREPO|nr:hypothetical protein DPMN_103587 [Dreissena polymorpha]
MAPKHGNVSNTNTTYGSIATISCQTGYILRDSGMVTCDSNGHWNSTSQMCTIIGECCSI